MISIFYKGVLTLCRTVKTQSNEISKLEAFGKSSLNSQMFLEQYLTLGEILYSLPFVCQLNSIT